MHGRMGPARELPRLVKAGSLQWAAGEFGCFVFCLLGCFFFCWKRAKRTMGAGCFPPHLPALPAGGAWVLSGHDHWFAAAVEEQENPPSD